jgi:hypothetical protein
MRVATNMPPAVLGGIALNVDGAAMWPHCGQRLWAGAVWAEGCTLVLL